MKITNSDFLSTIFPDLKPEEYCWTNAFATRPDDKKSDWTGNRTYPDRVADTPFGNAYFCVSALKPNSGQSHRRKENFSRLMCVVLDDAKKCDLAPSWKLETSTDNYQVGFMLSEPIDNVDIADRLHKALATQKLIKADKSGNNTVRYVRLPVGLNTKYEPNFPCVLQVWNPELRFTLDDICDALGLDLGFITNGATDANTSAYEPPTERISDEQLIRQIMTAESYHDPLNKLIARYAQRGMDRNAIVQSVQGFMKAGDDRSERWQSRFNDIARSTHGAIEKFAPKETKSEPYIKNVIGLGEFLSEIRAPYYVWEGIIQKNNLYAITANPGAGKTAISLAMALAMTQGFQIHGRKTMQSRVLYLCGENPDDVRLRFKSLMDQHGVTQNDVEGKIYFTKRPFSIDNDTAREQFLVEARLHAPYDVVFIDTVPAHSSVDDENSNTESHALAITLRGIGETIGEPCVLALMHPVKGAGRENLLPRGGSALTGSVDGVICIWQENKQLPSEMFPHKSKFRGNWNESLWFDLKSVELDYLIDNFGNAANSVVAMECIKEKSSDAVDVDPLLIPIVKDQILKFIHFMTSRGDWVGDDWSAPNSNNICKKIHHDFEQYPSMLKSHDAKRLALKAIESLKTEGMLIKENREVPNKAGKSKRDRSALGLWLTPKALTLLVIDSDEVSQPETPIQLDDVTLGV